MVESFQHHSCSERGNENELAASGPPRKTELKTLSCFFLLAPLTLCATVPSLAQLPRKPAPRGMLEVPSAGKGRILTSRMGGTASARKMLTALKMMLGEYFDKPITVTRAFADPDDQNLQAAFIARLRGVPVRGIVAVTMKGGAGQGTLMFDDARTFAKSFGGMRSKKTSGGGGGARRWAGGLVKLTSHTAPDGSARISLPSGFLITGAYKGTLDIVGPNGAVMALGAAAICTRHEAAGMFPGTAAVDFDDPVRATVDYVRFIGEKAGTRIVMKIIDTQPVRDWQNGRAAFIRYQLTVKDKTIEGFGLFAIMPTDVNQALFYQSYINSSPAHYRTQFPAMLQAWGTYSINPAVFKERLMAAAASLRGMSEIITSGGQSNAAVNTKVSEAWSDYMRDKGTWSDPSTGGRYKVDNTLTNGGGTPTVNGVALEPVALGDL